MSTVEELNQRFAIVGSAQITAGSGGLPRVVVKTPAAVGEVYLHGAHLTSWFPVEAEEVIFLSQHSQWQEGRAIRGGIPVCFPWFRNKVDDPRAPSHGFVRNKSWQLDSVKLEGDAVAVSFSTVSDEETRAWWPHDFRLEHRLGVGKELLQELVVSNTGSTTMRFEEALHTYYLVGAADQVRISGLDGVNYLDNTDSNREKRQAGEIAFTAQTDRAYMNTQHAVEISDPVLRRRIRLTKENSRTTVVWNPWRTGAKTLSDLGDDGWRTMACVEASNMRDFAIELAPGQQHAMKTVIQLV
ncbi:MAG TPA: D-hexose-6-phosphate mutarotase [Acidobacteriaceae bacterium]|nr:D-hexose-6-phosphate mutarotase [Acidobacteriaceae bacterium]